MTDQLIVGAGEVGQALHQLLPSARIRDVDTDDIEPADVLHVAFPWSDQFVDDVRTYQRVHGTYMVIVHSTVPAGTCDPHGWTHSPVRGRHPDLLDGLKTFVKWFGGRDAAAAAELFAAAGVSVECAQSAATTEAAKLWELVQFGVQVKVTQAVHDWCDRHDVDPSVVYRQFGESYNDGYDKLGLSRFVRPLLDHVPGPIGGHCVRQGAALLDHPLAAWVAE